MAKNEFNLVVIGGGSAGLVSSYIAAAVKAKVALVEKHKMGGDCLNTGCVPSKALIRSAKIANYIKRHKEFGIKDASAEIDFKDVMARVHHVIAKIEPHDSVERFTKLGVDCYTGNAKITSANTVEVNGKVLTTNNIIIATGAAPFVPKIPGLNNVDYLTSDNLWDLQEQPQNLLVLGGGPIGCELAQSFARLGSNVTQVEMMPHLMSREDEDVQKHVESSMRNDGVNVLLGHKAKRFETGKLIAETNGKDVEISFDKVLIALGRKPNVTDFGVEKMGIKLAGNGTIEADPFLRTNYKNIYVCGDVAGPYQFTHTASHQAWYTAVNSLFSPFKKYRVDYSIIPWCTFTDPEVARVGQNEEDAKANNIAYEVTTYAIDDLDRAITESENKGFVKVLTKPKTDKILGVTIVGPHAGELISEFVLAMKHNLGLEKILGTIHIYPTFAEANKFAAGNWKKAHTPAWALTLLEKYHHFRR
jgi:dihydrolipoamide dehydrogenase